MDGPFRILTLVPQPIDAPWAPAAAAAWRAIDQRLKPHLDRGAITIVHLAPATANALEERLRRESFHAIHVVSRGASRPAARQGTVTLEASDRRARDVNALNFARLCALDPNLEVVVLQVAGGPAAELEVVRDTVAEHATSVVYASGDVPVFAAELYSGLASGRRLEEAFDDAAVRQSEAPVSLHLKARTGRESPAPRTNEPAAPARETRQAGGPTAAPGRARNETPTPATSEVERKRATSAFDVFLCHNVGDKPAVMAIGRSLMANGVLPWLDQWELRPGMPWQRSLEEQIANIRAAAVFVGGSGIGPWQRQELDGFLREFSTRGCPVIPVLLPGAGGEPELPLFLRGMTWVDFRVTDPDPLLQLIWGITGRRPA
jgi:hypothetical protein